MNLLIFLAAYFLIIGAIGLITYILNSVGLMTIAQHRRIPHAAFAWVPLVGQAYITGAVADDFERRSNGIEGKLRYWLVGLSLFLLALSPTLTVMVMILNRGYVNTGSQLAYLIPLLLTLLAGLPFTVLWYIAHYKLYKSCQPANSVLFLVLSILFNLSPFLVFAVRHYENGRRVVLEEHHFHATASSAQGPAHPVDNLSPNDTTHPWPVTSGLRHPAQVQNVRTRRW